MKLVIPVWKIPTLPVAGSTERFPVRRVFCMGLNYLDHKRDIILTGTPGGIGPVKPGDIIEAGVGDLTPIKVRIGN